MAELSPLELLADQPAPIRDAAARLLDRISRPLTPRELDETFRLAGFSRSKRKAFTLALKSLAIIAVIREGEGG